jgi:hypothetical protein
MADGKHPIAPEMAALGLVCRPLRDLMAGLAGLPMQSSGEPDLTDIDPDFLVKLAESGELAMRILHDGLAAIGLLYAHTAPMIANGQIDVAYVVALGRLQVELAEVLPFIHKLSVECRRYTADYVSG